MGILETFIKEKWNLLNQNDKNSLRNFLVDILISNVNDDKLFAQNSFLINKLNNVIVLIAKNEWTSGWPNFISELCTSGRTNQNLCENNMKLLQLLSEEINEFWKSSLTTKKAIELKAKMQTEFEHVYSLCQFIFNNSQSVKQSLLVEAVQLYAEYTTWFPVNYVFNQTIISTFLENIRKMPFIRNETIKCIGQLFAFHIDKPDNMNNNNNNNSYFAIKNMTIQIYKSFIDVMLEITNKMDFSERHKSIDKGKISGFEKLCLIFENSLINFFKNNLNYIETFDFVEGMSSPNNFIQNYLEPISIGLEYLTQFQLIQNDEIFKAACDFWYWFTVKIVFLKEIDIDPDKEMPNSLYNTTLMTYLIYTNESYLYKHCYLKHIDKVRNTIVLRMNKPLEVKIDIDENGDLTTDPTTNTVFQNLHDTMKNTLIYLTNLDPLKTENLLEKKLNDLLENSKNLNRVLLNSVSWSAGCITGAMDEDLEKKFVVLIIRLLLTLCEHVKGKDNKAVCASNIMYVCGQYPRFLSEHWKFLKTVVKKLFEFMHEPHPGVQDFACETFLKISMKCGKEFVKCNENDNEPYINILVRNVQSDTDDLERHQKLMFYEALGNMINHEVDNQRKNYLINQLMSSTYTTWKQLFDQASMNSDILKNSDVTQSLELIVRINERVSISTKTIYWNFGSQLFDTMIKTFYFYSDIINNAFNNNEWLNVNTKSYMSFNRTLLKYFCTLVSSTDDNNIIMNQMLPGFGKLIQVYNSSHQDNRDPNILLLFSKVLEKLKNTEYNYIVSIWNYLCIFTLNMIKNDFQSFPEHRMNFFILLKSLITNAFEAIFQVQQSGFNKDIIDAISWAIRHNTPNMSETGLETMLILLNNISKTKIINGVDIVNPFYKAYYFNIFNDIFGTMTDFFHQSGLKLQIQILQILIQIIENGVLEEGLFQSGTQNKVFVLNKISFEIEEGFKQLNKNQIEAFCLGLFNKSYEYHSFKVLIRDFLISLKSFSGSNDALYAEEINKELEEAKKIEESKKNFIPGMKPIYDQEMQSKYSSNNYQDKDNQMN